ncbi:MAG TPA: hypothetical protein VN109_04125 [Devosia sp.]|jgi:TRAP-type C4-dicarboxylate transport system permease large subunit|nr:hypothetical protein [Devosia sp.]
MSRIIAAEWPRKPAAFAFASGYEPTNSAMSAALYGVSVGFVVYLLMELADLGRSAGAFTSTIAACGPVFVAFFVGQVVQRCNRSEQT